MKTLSNNYKKMFLGLILTFGLWSGLKANNLNRSAMINMECPSCTSESIAVDNANEVENWMANNEFWGTINASEIMEDEPQIEVAGWMASNEFWGSVNVTEVPELDQINDVQQWMGSNSFWSNGAEISNEQLEIEAPITVESWMADTTLWK